MTVKNKIDEIQKKSKKKNNSFNFVLK